jgi:hypothetical protein
VLTESKSARCTDLLTVEISHKGGTIQNAYLDGFPVEKGGVLAIMTQMITKETDFSTWYYKNDPTHICFFSKQTMRYLAQQWGVY